MVRVPFGLLIRCNPRNLPGVSPLLSKTVALRRVVVVVSATAIAKTLPCKTQRFGSNRLKQTGTFTER